MLRTIGEPFPVANSNPNPYIAPRVLFYRLRLDQADPQSSCFVNVVSPFFPQYAGVTVGYMTEPGWQQFNDDLIMFFGYRTPAGPPPLNIKPYYSEQIQIVLADGGYINAQAIYIDNGSGFITETNQVDYTVLGSSGSLSGAKILSILFDNQNGYRTVVISF